MAGSIIESIDENFLKCHICLENIHSPRCLPCLHFFCEECLEEWAKQSTEQGVLTCPNCMKETPIPEEGVKGYPAHFLVNSLQETVDMEKKKKNDDDLVCGNCRISQKQLTVCCLDCDELICNICQSLHKKIKSLKDHEVVTLADLSTSKVSNLVMKVQERYCEKHDDEQKRFYCKTCEKPVCRDCIVMKQYCRDHHYNTLSEASRGKVGHIRILIEQCNETKKKCQKMIMETVEVGNDTVKINNNTKSQFESDETSILQQADTISTKYSNKANSGQVKRTKDLRESLAKIESACELGTKLIESGSDFEILSNYTSIMQTLEEATTQTIPAENNEVAVHSYVVTKEWKLARHLDTRMGIPYGITFISENNIALRYAYQVNISRRSGKSKHIFDVPYGFNIAVTQNGKYVITGHEEKKCHLYDIQGKELLSFQSRDFGNRPSTPWPLAIDNRGNIIVGSVLTISTHNIRGALMSRFQTAGDPCGLAVTRNGTIAVTYFDHPWFQLIDSSGHILVNSHHPLKVKKWIPRAVCCSNRDELFVSNDGDPTGVYMYTSDGKYLQCVTTDVGKSRGMTLSKDDQELYVTDYDDKVVKIFQRP